MRIALLAAFSAVALASYGQAAQPAADLPQRLALFTQYLEPLRVQLGIPGLSAAIVSNGEIVWDGGFGFADVERAIRATADTPYRVASITKTFTSTLLMQCAARGRLSLDEPIGRYGSAITDPAATIRHVLAMASGSPPGSRYRYDGNRFDALTPVVEACTNAPYRVALADAILDRVAMFDSVPGQDLESAGPHSDLFAPQRVSRYRAVLARLAKPYVTTGGRPVVGEYPPRGIGASAGLVSTVRDLAKFDAALSRGQLLLPAVQAEAWTNYRLSNGSTSPYALGWFVQSTTAGQAVWHYGQWPTFSSLLVKIPSRGLTLILLANSDGLNARFPVVEGDVTVSPFARAFIAAVRG